MNKANVPDELEKPANEISPRISLLSAFLVHTTVEIPFFIFPVVLLLVGEDLFQNMEGAGWIGIGALGSIGILSMGLPSPFFGWLADRYRRGALMAFSLILSALGTLIVGMQGESFLWFALGVLIMGLGVGMYHPPGLSFVSSAFEDAEKGVFSPDFNRILGLHGIGGTLGGAIGPLAVYFLIDTISWREIYLIWVVPSILLAIAFWIFIGRKESLVEFSPTISHNFNPEVANRRGIDGNSVMLVIFAFFILMSLSIGMISFILSPFLIDEKKQFETAEAALFVGLSTLFGVIGQLAGGFLGDKYGEKMILMFSATLQVFVFIGIYVSQESMVLLSLYALAGICSALFWPSSNSLIAKNAPSKGAGFGWFMFVGNIIFALGPGIDGVLLGLDPNRYLLIFFFGSLSSLGAAIVLIFLRQPQNKTAVPVSVINRD